MWDEIIEVETTECYSNMDLGYLEDDLEEFGNYDDDFSSIWRDKNE